MFTPFIIRPKLSNYQLITREKYCRDRKGEHCSGKNPQKVICGDVTGQRTS